MNVCDDGQHRWHTHWNRIGDQFTRWRCAICGALRGKP